MTTNGFLSRCVSILETVQTVGDDVTPSEDASFDSLEALYDMSESDITDDFVFGLKCVRNGWIYRILGSPNHTYVEFIFEHDLYDAIVMNTVFTKEEQDELTVPEQSERLDTAKVSFEEADALLGSVRKTEQSKITSKLHTELANQTSCNFNISHTSTGDVFRVEANQKVFLTELTHGNIESAIVSITNTGKKIVAMLSDFYAVESVTPEVLDNHRNK